MLQLISHVAHRILEKQGKFLDFLFIFLTYVDIGRPCFIIFSRKLKSFRTIGFCPSFRIATRHASSGEKFILSVIKFFITDKLSLNFISDKSCNFIQFEKLSLKKIKLVKTQEAIKIAWNTRRGYLLRSIIKSDSFQQKNIIIITFRDLSKKRN